MNDNDRLKKLLSEEPVPEELAPEKIQAMLNEKTAHKKRNRIKVVSRIAACAAAVVICSSAVYFAGQGNVINKGDIVTDDKPSESTNAPQSEAVTQPLYQESADDYSEIYKLFRKPSEEYKKKYGSFINEGNEAVSDAETGVGSVPPGDSINTTEQSTDHYDTYDQEQGVLESDIAKTDGKNIYYLCSSYDNIRLNVASVENGKFTSEKTIEIDPLEEVDDTNKQVYASGMYIYNGMIEIVGEVYYSQETAPAVYNGIMTGVFGGYDAGSYVYSASASFVAVYTAEETPQLIDIYYQDGSFNDVRITPDGYMHLVSCYTTRPFSTIDGSDDIDGYIPKSGCTGGEEFIYSQDIILPEEGFGECSALSYTVMGSIDLNNTGTVTHAKSKAIAGYTGYIYCSQDNLYITENKFVESGDSGKVVTAVTRFAIGGGEISAAAKCELDGSVNDQFSMSEYDGKFRIATTNDNYAEGIRDNGIYVLDMDLNIIGSLTGIAEGEQIKSVNFSGDTAYVVTFYQTDPLFAIDLSDPAAPAVLDEYKITGYSSYMQKWDGTHLLGFGEDGNEDGRMTGIKLVMFDNSEPSELKEAGKYSVNGDPGTNESYEWVYSIGVWDRKALLILPEKNIIGMPVNIGSDVWQPDGSYSYSEKCEYMFFSYDNGKFTFKGEVVSSTDDKNEAASDQLPYNFNRTVCIGDHVYVLSENKFVSADIETMTIRDEINFAEV